MKKISGPSFQINYPVQVSDPRSNVICPKCGHKNVKTAHACTACGIIFIKWLIQQYRADRSPKKARSSFGLPRTFSRTVFAAGVLAGLAAGAALSHFLAAPHPSRSVGASSDNGVSLPAIERRTDAIVEEARALGREHGVALTAWDFTSPFRQGYEAFNEKNLSAVARKSGAPVPVLRIQASQYMERLETPFRCRSEGPWTYHKRPPGGPERPPECWGLLKRQRGGSRDHTIIWETFWQRYSWISELERWALFSPNEEQRLFRRYISDHLGPEAVREDVSHSEKGVREAGGDKALIRKSVIRAFKTRLLREGALYRLDILSH